MPWSLGREDDVITEWERSDGYATVRVRERGDGGFVARLDVMEQAADESAYERERFDDREAALDRAAAWREVNATSTPDRRGAPSRLVSATPRHAFYSRWGGDHHDRTTRRVAGPRRTTARAGRPGVPPSTPVDRPETTRPEAGVPETGPMTETGGDRPTEASDDG